MNILDRYALDRDNIEIITELASGEIIGVYRYLYTTGVVVVTADYDEATRNGWDGFKKRFCYATYASAVSAAARWDGEGDPPGEWIKDKSPGQDDRLNPNFGREV